MKVARGYPFTGFGFGPADREGRAPAPRARKQRASGKRFPIEPCNLVGMWTYDEPEQLPAHLRDVVLHEYTENIPRPHAQGHGRCGALPARAFRLNYPLGCYRERTHEGSHSALATTAQSLDRKARLRGWRPS